MDFEDGFLLLLLNYAQVKLMRFCGWHCEAVDIAETCVGNLVCTTVDYLKALLGFD